MKNTKAKQIFEPFIVTYNNEKYDIGNFINKHPGGKDVFSNLENTDITKAFDHIGHSESAMTMLKRRLVKPDADEASTAYSQSVNSSKASLFASQENLNKSKDSLFKSHENLNEDEIDDFRAQEKEIDMLALPEAKFIKKKLFTPEDKFNVHKILGLSCLISYIYRYCYVLPTTGSLGFTNDFFSYFTLFLHMFLSCSSLIFHVLRFRIVENPLIIYEEYRLHAILFSSRGFFVSLIGLNFSHLPKGQLLFILDMTILLVHITVDLITYKFGKKGVTAVRNENGGSKLLNQLRMFYSSYQLIAMGSHLELSNNLPDLGFNTMIAIQSSAFLMTLKRKNLIQWWSHAFWYTLCLIFSIYVVCLNKSVEFFIHIFAVAVLRMGFNANKYVLWTTYVILTNNILFEIK